MAITTEEIPQLSINRLIKGHYIQAGRISGGHFQGSENDPALYLDSDCTTSEKIVRIQYEVMNGSVKMDYEIKICSIPFNRGKSINLYWICPVSKLKAKILYLCPKTNLYIHRTAFPERIYYPNQLISLKYRVQERFDKNEKKLLEHFVRVKKKTYQGKNTRVSDAINLLVEKRRTLNLLCIEQVEAHIQHFATRL